MAKASQSAPKPGKDTIYVDVDDEITAIIDKVESSSQKIVALVLPKRAAMLQSIVNMRLLKRSTTDAGKNVVLITSEAALLPLAGAAGLHVAKNLQSKPEIPPSPHGGVASADEDGSEAEESHEDNLDDQPQKLDYDKPIGALAAAHEDKPEEIDLDDEDAAIPAAAAAGTHKKAKKDKSLKVPNFDRFRVLLFGGIAALILLIIFFIFANTVLPKATINVTTTSTPVSLNSGLTASGTATALDESKKIIPSALKTSDQTATQQVTATGQKNLGQTATGTVSMTAQKCSGNPFIMPDPVPLGTGISANGQSYITQESTTFHGTGASGGCFTYTANGGTHITAQAAGSKYNTGGGTSFTVPGGRADGSTVSASGSTSGGTDNNVTVLTQADVDGAKSKISTSDSDKFSQDFQNQLASQGYYVFTSTMKPGDPVFTATPAVGQQTNNATVTVKITYSVLAVQKSDLTNFVKDALNKQIDQSKEKISNSNVLDGLTINVVSQDQANASLSVNEDTTAVPILDEQAIKNQAEGKKEGDIRAYINTYPGVKNVDVKMSPFWRSSAPKNPAKIKLIQNQVKSDS
jgi:hypothetical protein